MTCMVTPPSISLAQPPWFEAAVFAHFLVVVVFNVIVQQGVSNSPILQSKSEVITVISRIPLELA